MGAGVVRRREPKRRAGVMGGRYARRRRRSYRAQGLENRVHSFGGGEERPSVALLVAVGIAELGAQRLHRGRTLERVRAQRVEERARRGLGSRHRHTTAVEGGANARGVAEWRTRAGLGFWDARTERSNLPRLVASSASPLPPLPPLPRLPRGRGLRAPSFRPAKNVKKPRLELVQKVHLI